MRVRRFVVAFALGALGFTTRVPAAARPSDVPSSHWAATAVEEVLQNKVMTLPGNGKFNGEAVVTHTQAVIALANLGRALETGAWKAGPSKAVTNKVIPTLEQANWKQRPLTRYALAAILARMGDYAANGLPRPDPNSKARGKSSVLPDKVKVTVPRTSPAYESLVYLTSNRMISADSPFLKPTQKPVRGGEFSTALAQMITGLNDQQTDLGLDEAGSTNDAGFHKKTPRKP